VSDMDRITRRPTEYLAETGVPLLAAGLVCFLMGGFVIVQYTVPKTFVAQEAPKWAAIACAVAVAWLARVVNQRAVFPRGGYVEGHPPSRIWMWLTFVTAFFLFSVPWPGHVALVESRLLWPAFAIAGTVICLVSGRRQRNPAMVWFGVYLAGLAPLLWWIREDNYERWGWLQLCVGIPVAIVGAIRLRRFLKTNALPVQTPHG
jgi:hypothetical protein